MSLHAKNIAAMAGAEGDEVDRVAAKMKELGQVRVDVAERLLADLRSSDG
jgi:hydroxymethylglutaryl-CoA reductase